ncbi:hypothetical protein QJS10_CPB17g00610 [Acorus calamus]|uniref:Uncharacterized protein n=1 Tax=Acorus calamus TaxID=4465 RepID=A0AAV9CVV9_ACOCL|nr:hypothetical protein QJS10_CPB17g00610 [Acorus calamus]
MVDIPNPVGQSISSVPSGPSCFTKESIALPSVEEAPQVSLTTAALPVMEDTPILALPSPKKPIDPLVDINMEVLLPIELDNESYGALRGDINITSTGSGKVQSIKNTCGEIQVGKQVLNAIVADKNKQRDRKKKPKKPWSELHMGIPLIATLQATKQSKALKNTMSPTVGQGQQHL